MSWHIHSLSVQLKGGKRSRFGPDLAYLPPLNGCRHTFPTPQPPVGPPAGSVTRVLRSGWVRVVVVASLVGVVALISNITSTAQLSGEADTLLTIRFTVSKVVNSGTVWAGLLIVAGWLVRRPLPAALAGVAAGEVALVIHYGLGQVFGIYDADIWASNSYWFVAALLLGAPLGLIGALARRADILGLLARLVIPAGALIEPFYLGMLRPIPDLPAPDRISSIVCGVILIVGGVVGAAVVIQRWRGARSAADRAA